MKPTPFNLTGLISASIGIASLVSNFCRDWSPIPWAVFLLILAIGLFTFKENRNPNDY